MNYLKTRLPFKAIIILLIALIYCLIVIKLDVFNSKYSSEKEITGVVLKIKQKDKYQEIIIKGKEKLLVYDKTKTNLKLGYKIYLKGELIKPKDNTNFNLFNYRKYLLGQKIYWIFNADEIKIKDKNSNFLYKIQNYLNERINKITYSKKYIQALVLGDNDIEQKIKEIYQINGISHLLAVSGMHVTLLSMIILNILKIFINNKKIIYLILILIISFYAVITGLKPPIIRATLMFILLTIKKSNPLKYLILVAAFLLIYNPYCIYDVGFKFSFIICFYLLLFGKISDNYLKTSVIAFLASIPILINNFYSINLLSPLINVIFIPLMTFVIFPLSLFTLIFNKLDHILYHFISIFETLSVLFSKVGISISLARVSIVLIIVYYILITLTLLNKKYLKYLIVLIIIHYNINLFNFGFKINMLDVNQGDSTLIKIQNKNILIDTGGVVGKKYLAKKVLIPYFKSVGIKKIDYLILTHGDYDHMGEALNLVKNFKVDKVIFNCDEFNDLENELVSFLNKNNIKYYSCIEKLNINDYQLYFLDTKEYDNENDNSNVIYTELNGYKFLFMGDAGKQREKDILEKYNLSNIDFLKVGHHGSSTSSSKEFIDNIKPKYSLISVGENNRYGHPKDSVLNILSGSKIYRTDINGSIEIKIKNDGYSIETCKP